MNLFHLMSERLLAERIEQGYVNAREHPELPLTIYNYSAQTQYEWMWDDVTRHCRGLIVHNETNHIIARPFPKFFNYGEIDHSHLGVPETVLDKVDGSLGIWYPHHDKPAIATRGSFESEQAKWATKWIRDNHPDWRPPEGVTPLFEIIYPDNRIVVNYEDLETLILLGGIDIKTGRDVHLDWPGERVRTFPATSVDALVKVANNRENTEGFVCRWPDGTRVKIKSEEYVELHRIVTGLSSRHVWEELSEKGVSAVRDLLEATPDEFHDWIRETAGDLLQLHASIRKQAVADLIHACDSEGMSRKEQAENIKNQAENPGLCFALLDSKDVDSMIWKMIKPERETPVLTPQEDDK